VVSTNLASSFNERVAANLQTARKIEKRFAKANLSIFMIRESEKRASQR
jgi:hypothetical protein